MRSKQARFAHNAAAKNLVQAGKPLFETIKGKWQEVFFRNNNPLTLELACGKGEYTLGLAKVFPDRNFIGIDIKGDRLWKGSSVALEEGLTNVGFLRIFIHDLEDFFAENEVAEIWLTFPDPRPKDRDEKRRLTSRRFMEYYKNILQPGGWFKFKTDNTRFFDYTLEELQLRKDIVGLEFTQDLASSPLQAEHYGITTRYEELFSSKGEAIKYLKFKFSK